jgi:hypothetical protein
MKFFTTLFSIAALASFASAGCFSGGERWCNPDTALGAVKAACGPLSGVFIGGETRRNCIDGCFGQKFDFTIRSQQSSQGTLSVADCIDGLSKEVEGCDNGGSSELLRTWLVCW